MFTGKLDRLLTLQTNTPTQDTHGEPIESWANTTTMWAEQLSQSIVEKFTGEQDAGFRFVHWRVRYRAGITNLQRILDPDSNAYNIHGKIEVGRKHYYILKTELVI